MNHSTKVLLWRWTVALYSKLGAEGEVGHSENGVSRSYDFVLVPCFLDFQNHAQNRGCNMRMQESNKRKILYCKQRIHTNGATYYDPPVRLDVNVVPVSSLWNSSLMGVTQQGKYIFSVDASLYAICSPLVIDSTLIIRPRLPEYFPYGIEPWGFYAVPEDEVIDIGRWDYRCGRQQR